MGCGEKIAAVATAVAENAALVWPSFELHSADRQPVGPALPTSGCIDSSDGSAMDHHNASTVDSQSHVTSTSEKAPIIAASEQSLSSQPAVPVDGGSVTDPTRLKEDVLREVIAGTLHRKAGGRLSDDTERAVDCHVTYMWHIGLHYLLPFSQLTAEEHKRCVLSQDVAGEGWPELSSARNEIATGPDKLSADVSSTESVGAPCVFHKQATSSPAGANVNGSAGHASSRPPICRSCQLHVDAKKFAAVYAEHSDLSSLYDCLSKQEFDVIDAKPVLERTVAHFMCRRQRPLPHITTDHQNLTAASSPGVQHIAKSVESEASRHSSDSWPLQLKVVDSKRDPTEYMPNREICLPELIFSEIVPTRDPRLLAVHPDSSVYFDTAKAFARGIPPEDWFEQTPDDADWMKRAKNFLVHLPVNSLCPLKIEVSSDDPCSLSPSAARATVEHAAEDQNLAGFGGMEQTASADSDMDDDRISQLLQSCMEPAVVNIKTEPLESVGDQAPVLAEHISPMSKSAVAVADGKAQRLLKLKQSGISPEMLRRRLQKIEEKLSALRKSKAGGPIPDGGGSESADIPQPKRSDDSVRIESQAGTEKGDERQDLAPGESSRSIMVATSGHQLQSGDTDYSDNLPINLKVIATSACHANKAVSKLHSRSGALHSDLAEEEALVSPQPLNGVDSLQNSHESVLNPPPADSAGSWADASSQSQFLEHPSSWLVGALSLDTKWDSQFIESLTVQRILLEAMQNWRLRKPLDLIMSGQLRDVALDWTPMQPTWKTDRTVDCCWNSILWYFGCLLGEPADRNSHPLLSSSTEDEGINMVECSPDDDWFGFSRRNAETPAMDTAVQRSSSSLEKPNASAQALDNSELHVEPDSEKTPTPSKSASSVDSVVLPSEKLPTGSAVSGSATSPLSRSVSSRKDKSKHSDEKPVEASSGKRKKKHEDRKRSKHKKPPAVDNSSGSSGTGEPDGEKERGDGAEKHSGKSGKHRREVVEGAEEIVQKHVESVNAGRASSITSLLQLLVGGDRDKLSLLSHAVGSTKQFSSQKLTMSSSLPWAVALALLEEDNELSALRSGDADARPNSNGAAATESSVKHVFDSVSDFMNAILSGKSAPVFPDAKSATANGLSTSHLEELYCPESDACPASPLPDAITSDAEKGLDGNSDCGTVGPTRNDDVHIIEEMKRIQVERHAVNRLKFSSSERNESRKVVLSKLGLNVQTESIHEQLENIGRNGGGTGSDERLVESEDVYARHLQQWSSIIGEALVSLREKHSRCEDGKDAPRPQGAKETRAIDREISEQTKRKPPGSSHHHSDHEKSKRAKHEKESGSRAHQKGSSSDKHFEPGFEIISDTEFEGLSSAANREKALRAGWPRSGAAKAVATDKDMADNALSEVASRLDVNTAVVAGSDGSQSSSANNKKVLRTRRQHSGAAGTKAVADNEIGDTYVALAGKIASHLENYESVFGIDGKTSTVQPEVWSVSTAPTTVWSSSPTSSVMSFRPAAIYKMAGSATAPPTKTATTDMMLATRGPRFMQAFRRSQIAKRRCQREGQQTATGGKLLATLLRSPNSMAGLAKPVVRPIGLSLEATLAALSGSTPSSVPPVQPSSDDVIRCPPQTPVPSSSPSDTQKSASISSTSVTAVPSLMADSSPLPLLPSSSASGNTDATPPPDDDACNIRTTSAAGPTSVLSGVKPSSGHFDVSQSFDQTSSGLSSSGVQGYGDTFSAEQCFAAGDYVSSYWTAGCMPSYGAYGYESSTVNPWYYGLAWHSMPHPDGSYGAFPPIPQPPPEGCLPTSQQESASFWFPAAFGADSQCMGGPTPMPVAHRLRAPPRLSQDDELATNPQISPPQKSPLLPTPPVPPTSAGGTFPPLQLRRDMARFLPDAATKCGPAPPGLPKKRFYVYSDCTQLKTDVTEFLLSSGMRAFDPFNMSLTLSTLDTSCVVFVDAESAPSVDRLPNLLRLKRDVRVIFRQFVSCEDVVRRNVTFVFPRSGVIVIHDDVLLRCSPDTVKSVCQFVAKHTLQKPVAWLLKLSSHVFNSLQTWSMGEDGRAEIARVLLEYSSQGAVQSLSDDFTRPGHTMSLDDYFSACCNVQLRLQYKFRHFIFVSDLPRDSKAARDFIHRGVDVMTLPDFLHAFIGPRVPCELPKTTDGEWTVAGFEDATMSTAVETLKTAK